MQREEILHLCRLLEQSATDGVTLAQLGKKMGYSRFHVQKAFKAAIGVSPKQYVDQCRIRNFKMLLRDPAANVTTAGYSAGFGSSSRVYERATRQFGMTPLDYRDGGRGLAITYACADTALGHLLLAATDRGLCFVHFGESEEDLIAELKREYPNARIKLMSQPPSTHFREWMDSLNAYIAGERAEVSLPLHVRATAFQMKVWKYLQSIPPGAAQSYEQVAAGIGKPGAARAVASACAANDVALVIPCHRVIRGSGELGGYRWGLARKRALLLQETKKRRPERSADAVEVRTK